MRRKERGRQLLRILKLIKLFEHSRYGLTINELCREMAVTRRTLYRDLEMVEDAGYRFVKEGGGGGFSKNWRFPPGMRKAPDKPYTESELLSLYFCMNLLQPFRGTPLRDGLESLLAKIEATFTEEEREYFGDLVFTHVAKMTPSKDYRRHASAVGTLSRACLERKWHPTQRIEQNANGKVTLKMTVQGLAEVARWVLYHAPYAKALEPKELRTMVAENAAKSAAAHKG